MEQCRVRCSAQQGNGAADRPQIPWSNPRLAVSRPYGGADRGDGACSRGHRWRFARQFSASRALSPTDKAEYALTVSRSKKQCGPIAHRREEDAKAYARELSGEDIWVGFDAMVEHDRLVIGW